MTTTLEMEVLEPPLVRARECDVVQAFVAEALNEGDYSVIREFFAHDVRDYSADRFFADGMAGLVTALHQARAIWPDLYAKITTMQVSSGLDITTVDVALAMTGTRVALNLQPHPLDGQQVRWRQRHILAFEAGLVRSHHGWTL